MTTDRSEVVRIIGFEGYKHFISECDRELIHINVNYLTEDRSRLKKELGVIKNKVRRVPVKSKIEFLLNQIYTPYLLSDEIIPQDIIDSFKNGLDTLTDEKFKVEDYLGEIPSFEKQK